MEEPVKTPPPETPAPPAPPADQPVKNVSNATVDSTAADATAASTAPHAVTPGPSPAKQGSTSKKPIFVIVVSMVLFVLLCAVAFYAYSQSI